MVKLMHYLSFSQSLRTFLHLSKGKSIHFIKISAAKTVKIYISLLFDESKISSVCELLINSEKNCTSPQVFEEKYTEILLIKVFNNLQPLPKKVDLILELLVIG